jgi:uncharacterized protein
MGTHSQITPGNRQRRGLSYGRQSLRASLVEAEAVAHSRAPRRIATELGAKPAQVAAAVALLDEGATVPFISRYRKEATGGLDDTQLRTLEERLGYLRELEERRARCSHSIDEQGKLTPALEARSSRRHQAAARRSVPAVQAQAPHQGADRARSRAGAAGRGAAGRSDAGPGRRSREVPEACIRDATGRIPVADVKAALDGARQILMEQFAEDAELLGALRTHLQEQGVIVATVADGKESEARSSATTSPIRSPIHGSSHRALALFRGRNEEILLRRDEAAGGGSRRPMRRSSR